MKQKKIFFIILLCILFLPFIVKAEECDITKITITSIEQKDIEGNTKEIEDPIFNDRNINFNIKMYELGDSITYDIRIKNDSEEDYMIDENSFKTDSEYMLYTLKTNDNSNVVNAKSNKNISLTIEYKKEIDDSLFVNNKVDASNTLNLSFNTSEKEKTIDIITTDNIDQIKNPLTSNKNIGLIWIIILITLLIIYLTYSNKKKYNKFLIIVLAIILIPEVYAICKSDIAVESTIEVEKAPKLFNTVVGLSTETNACVKKYEGNVTDEVGKTVPATKVYFDNCPGQRNVIFGGFCWQIIRTTETSGVKMIYNGDPVNGKCLSNRNLHQGITSGNSKTTSLNDNYIYGSGYTYDLNNNTFTLIDTETATWSDSTYRNLMGKYTCKSSSNTCSTLYNINGYKSNTSAYVGEYNIGNTYYSQIGATSFNPDYTSLSMIGYKYNYVYNYLEQQPGSPEYKYGSSFTYDNNNNMYTLSGETQMVSNYSSNYRNIGNTHYTCWNTTGTCEKIYYIYYAGNWVMHDLIEAFYIELSNGESGPEAMNKMINNEDINKYDSSIKGLIDNWYRHNMVNYTNSLEDTVYCNARKSISLGGWDPISGSSNISNHIDFKAVALNNKDISCERVLDQFAVSNKKAELTYPIALFSIEEHNNLDSNDLRKTGSQYWSMSPARFYMDGAYVRGVLPTGELHYNDYGDLFYSNGVRPAISLKYNKVVTSGSGSEEDPWIIE